MSRSDSRTESIPPRPAKAVRARLRKATMRAPSCRESAPATQAAAISPWLWPTTADGSTPQERQRAARATMTAKRTDALQRGGSLLLTQDLLHGPGKIGGQGPTTGRYLLTED